MAFSSGPTTSITPPFEPTFPPLLRMDSCASGSTSIPATGSSSRRWRPWRSGWSETIGVSPSRLVLAHCTDQPTPDCADLRSRDRTDREARIGPTREAVIGPTGEAWIAPTGEAWIAPTGEAWIAPTRVRRIAPWDNAPTMRLTV